MVWGDAEAPHLTIEMWGLLMSGVDVLSTLYLGSFMAVRWDAKA